MTQNKEYYAFISYSHRDEEWAKWLQHEFEHYHLPTTLNGMADVPDRFRPIFRDVDELSGGELKPQITQALKSSANLVIICSPHSAKSPYVDGEIREFVEIGEQEGVNNASNIFPFIIDGIPHATEEPDRECFPEALRQLPTELIAGDATKHGREHAFVKILSGTLRNSHIGFSMLWNQFERDRIEAERKERERRDKLLLLESRYLSEKALAVTHVDSRLARLLVLQALPKDVNDPDDRPYCPEAESALRKVCNYKSAVLKGHEGGVKSFRLNSGGDRGVSVSLDRTVRIWDVETGLLVGEPLKGHTDDVLDATFSHNGRLIASCSKDATIMLWDVETGMPAGSPIEVPSLFAKRLVFTHDDRLLIALSSGKALWIWNVEEHRLIREIQIPGSNDLAIDRDDRWVALATLQFSIEIYDLKELKRVVIIPNAHTESLTSIGFSPDGVSIVSAAFDGKFKTWDWMRGETMLARNVGKVVGAYAPPVFSVGYSPDGKTIVTASRDGVIRIWNAVSGEQEGEPLLGHDNSVCTACFSPDGSLLASASLDGTVRIWDITPQVPYKMVGRARNIPFERKVVKPLENIGFGLVGHSARVRTLAFSPDEKLLVSASAKELKVWDVGSGLQLGMDLKCFDDYHDVMFLENGRGIVAETEKDYDVLFDWVPLQELIEQVRQQVGDRQLTPEERRRYYLD